MGLADLSSFGVSHMVTFALLGSVAVGALLAATAYFICRNEIVRKN
jgi:hypothetical protein